MTETKICTKCKVVLPIVEFRFRAGKLYQGKEVRHSWCSPCNRLARTLSRQRHKTRTADVRLQYLYGITLEQKQQMFQAQDGKCAICKKQFTSFSKAYVDHNHVTTAIRKLLCHNCNSILGLARERQEVLLCAASYLHAHEGLV